MNSVPLWLQGLKIYIHHSPLTKGKTRLLTWAYKHLTIPDIVVESKLDRTLSVQLQLKVWIDYNIYCQGIYEQYLTEFFKKQLNSDTVFVDIGSYIGQYAMIAAHAAPLGHVYAFEPNQESVSRLHHHVSKNHLSNIEIIPKAVGNKSGVTAFYITEQPYNSSLLTSHARVQRMQEVSIISLDEFCAKRHLTQIDIIKIDVEEAEDGVIQGSLSLLEAARPLVIVEIGRKSANEGNPKSLQLLRALDYQFYKLNRSILKPLSEQISPGQEIIAVPKEKRNLLRV